MLHDVIHLLLGYRDTAARTRLSVAEAMQEDRGAFVRRSFLVIADIQAVLIMVDVINDMLRVSAFYIEAGKVFQADQFVIVVSFPRVS